LFFEFAANSALPLSYKRSRNGAPSDFQKDASSSVTQSLDGAVTVFLCAKVSYLERTRWNAPLRNR
jgi:hypothetical protein